MPAGYLLSLFKLRRGELYSEKEIREGLNKARELYGALGRFEFTAYPDLRPRDAATAADPGATTGPVVDVTLRVDEGPRYTESIGSCSSGQHDQAQCRSSGGNSGSTKGASSTAKR